LHGSTPALDAAGGEVIKEGALLSSQIIESNSIDGLAALVVRVGSRVCALPIGNVRETMRVRPIESIAGAPSYVLGVSIIRGVPVPVVDLAKLVGASGGGEWSRFVTLSANGRPLALAVQGVLGVHELAHSDLQKVSPLLDPSRADVVKALGALDRDLLAVLDMANAVPEPVWQTIALRGRAS
jgi:purine-binding chemotaxis protein CheW